MTSNHQITFIKKDPKRPVTHQITHVGGNLSDGTPWTIPTQDAIAGIKSGRFAFFISDQEGGHTEKVIIASSPVHGAFLRAESDRSEPKRLMTLPEPEVKEDDYY